MAYGLQLNKIIPDNDVLFSSIACFTYIIICFLFQCGIWLVKWKTRTNWLLVLM